MRKQVKFPEIFFPTKKKSTAYVRRLGRVEKRGLAWASIRQNASCTPGIYDLSYWFLAICHDDSDLLSPDLKRDLSRKECLRGQPRPGVDFNVSACSQLSVAAVNTAVSPGVCTPTPRFQD